MSAGSQLASLRRWNIGVGAAHLIQGMAILALSNDFAIPVQANVSHTDS